MILEKNKKIMKKVFVSGHFNILHPGHLRLLRFAKELGDKLIVGLESDRIAGESAYITQNLRFESLKEINWIDEVLIFDEKLDKFLEKIKPNIILKGNEFKSQNNIESKYIDKFGGKLIFFSGNKLFSTKDLLRQEFLNSDKAPINFPHKYFNRHNISKIKLKKVVNKFSELKICVLGDLIIDEYISCEPLGMSQEDPTIVVSPNDFTKFIGGAGIVAAHAASLGANVEFISVAGNDKINDFALKELHRHNVQPTLLIDENRPTTLKQRFRSKDKTLLRVSYLHQNKISEELQLKIFEKIEDISSDIDLFVFSDFNYGCLPQKMVNKIIELLKSKNIFISADSQSSSQIGDISRFKQMGLITPTEHEARLSLKDINSGLVFLAEKIKNQAIAENCFLKLGSDGLLVQSNDKNFITDRLDALNSSPKDSAGAGDSLLIVSSMVLALKGNIWMAAGLGSLAAAIQVGRVGNVPLKLNEILNEIK